MRLMKHKSLLSTLFFRLRRNREGATGLEFALIAFPLFLLIMGTLDFGALFFAQSILETAASAGARLTSVDARAVGREQYIRNQVTRLSAGFLQGSHITITTTNFVSPDPGRAEPCYSRPNPPPCNGVPGTGFADINGNGVWDGVATSQHGAMVIYTVSYPWTFSTPYLWTFFGDRPDFEIIATAAVSNGV